MGRLQPHHDSSRRLAATMAPSGRWTRRPRRSRVRGSRGPGLPLARSPGIRGRTGPWWAAPMPSLGHPRAQCGWSTSWGTSTCGDSCQRGGLCRARAAVVHDGGDAREQRLVVDLADDETALLGVGQREVGPASAENDAPPMRAGRLDRHPAKGSKKRGSDSATRPSPTASRRSYRSGWISLLDMVGARGLEPPGPITRNRGPRLCRGSPARCRLSPRISPPPRPAQTAQTAHLGVDATTRWAVRVSTWAVPTPQWAVSSARAGREVGEHRAPVHRVTASDG